MPNPIRERLYASIEKSVERFPRQLAHDTHQGVQFSSYKSDDGMLTCEEIGVIDIGPESANWKRNITVCDEGVTYSHRIDTSQEGSCETESFLGKPEELKLVQLGRVARNLSKNSRRLQDKRIQD